MHQELKSIFGPSSSGGPAGALASVASMSAAQKSAFLDGVGAIDSITKRIKGGRAGAIGDSITATGAASWFTYLALESNGLIRRAKNTGVSGNTTDQMAARIAADLPKSLRLDILFVTGGTNDPSNGIAPAKTVSNIIGMCNYAQSIGASPVVVLPPPRSSNTAEIIALRVSIAASAASLGIICIDPWSSIIDVSGGPLAGALGDGTHPTSTTAKAGGVAGWLQLAGYVAESWRGTSLISSIPGAIITTDAFFPDANADGIPNGWSGYNSNGLVSLPHTITQGAFDTVWRISTNGVNTGGAGVAGEVIMDRTISGLSIAGGDRLALSAKCSVGGASSGIYGYCLFHGVNGTNETIPFDKYTILGDFSDKVIWGEFLAGSGGITSILIRARLGTTGTTTPSVGFIEFSGIQIWNLTSMGLA